MQVTQGAGTDLILIRHSFQQLQGCPLATHAPYYHLPVAVVGAAVAGVHLRCAVQQLVAAQLVELVVPLGILVGQLPLKLQQVQPAGSGSHTEQLAATPPLECVWNGPVWP